VTLRPETAIGPVEVLKTGVIALPARSSAGCGDPVRVDVPARGPSFCAPRPADAGASTAPAPTAAVHGTLLVAVPTAGAGGLEGDLPREVWL